MKRSTTVGLWLALGVALAGLPGASPLTGQDQPPAEKGKPGAPRAWTLDEALEQLRLYPRDAYLQFVALQLARRGNRLDAIATEIERLAGRPAEPGVERARRVDLFSIFTGALAVQESLQLDTMRGEARPRGRRPPVPSADPQRRVRVADLVGPTIKSHPWDEMLGDKKPEISPLARSVPEDFYYVEFHSLSKLLEALDVSDLWGTHLFSQAAQEARSQRMQERIEQQLAVVTSPILRGFYDLAVEEVAITGSDLFAREGSDVTLLFRIKQPAVFRARMDEFLDQAARARPDSRRETGEYQGVAYVALTTPDRAVSVYSAYPTPDLHVRSNSRVALQRVLEAIQGRRADGQPVRRLGDSTEFAYIRTIFPRGDAAEDGFVYLSDPFIRRLVGPQLKLTERRRMLCYNHLRMIGHAAMLYRTEMGRAPASLDALVKAHCTPGVFGEGALACPDGGHYSLSADGLSGICSHHGPVHALVPCCEIPVTEVTGAEADEYRAFLEEYNRYWRTFFDPIALRIQVSPRQYRVETVVLPLIDNSIYTGLATVLGGQPEPLDGLPVPGRNIFTVAGRLHKEQLLQQAGLAARPAPPNADAGRPGLPEAEGRCANNLRQIGLALHNYHDVHRKFPAQASYDGQGKPLLSWRVHLLPFLEQEALYREFHLDEPWDSEHNRKLLARMPAVYRCPAAKEGQPGRTGYLGVVGEQAFFTGRNQPLRIADFVDGTSNTIAVLEASEARAVPWTKPDDWKPDREKPGAGLLDGRHPGGGLVLLVDGSVHFLQQGINLQTLNALFTRNGGEPVRFTGADRRQPQRIGQRRGPTDFLGLPAEHLEQLDLAEFLTRGLGNQVSLNLYDAVPLFDFNLPGFLGLVLGSMEGRRMDLDTGTLLVSFVVASLNAPVYIALPVQDTAVVDRFLDRLDPLLAFKSRERQGSGFFSFDGDFYRFAIRGEERFRSFGVRFGPVKWRFFWGRIGNGLYIASKPFILEDLLAEAKRGTPPDRGPAAHAMIRMRPQNWKQVLADYRLGWAENNRMACIENLGPLSSLARGMAADPARPNEAAQRQALDRMAREVYGLRFYCPDGGQHVRTPDGRGVLCSVHGSALAPRQQDAPAEHSELGKLLGRLTGVTVTLTFLHDGLHAIVVIDRQ